MRKNKMKRAIASGLSAIMMITSTGLTNLGPIGAFAADVPDTYPTQFSLAWDDTTVDEATAVDGDTMTLTPYNDGTEDTTGGTTAKLVLDYTLGSYENEEGVMEPLIAEAGDIEIRLPAYIFKDRSNNAVGKPYLGISTKKDSDSGFYYSIDTKNTDTLNDDEIVIKNFATITGDQTFRCNVTYWSDQAHAVKDGFENTFKASTTLRDGSEIKYQKDSNDLTVKYKTSTEIEKINPVNGNVTYPKLYKNWQSSWGTNSAGTTDYAKDHENGYFYVAWPVTTVLAQWPTQPGKLNDMTVELSADAGTTSDIVAVTAKGYTFSNTASLPTKNEELDDYQSGYIITAHKASEFEASGKDTICITADIKTSFTGVDGYTSGAGIVQKYNYDSLDRTGNGGTFIPYKYAPSPEYDDESDGFISLLQISDLGEVLPLKSRTQPGKTADNAWDFVMTGEADGTDELTADYINNEPATTSETDGESPLNALLLDEPETENTNPGTAEPETAGGETNPAETETETQTESETETETSATSLLDEALDITDADADEGTKVYGKKYYTMELVDDLLILEGEDLRAGDYQFDNIPYIKIQGIAAAADRDDQNVTINAGTGEWNVENAEVLAWKPGQAAIEGLTLYCKVGNGEWQEYDYAGKSGEIAGAGINGVTAIKAEYQSYYGYAVVQVFTSVDMIKSQHVMDIIGDKSSVTLWNVDSMRAYDQAGHLLTAHETTKYGGTLRDHLAARDEAYKQVDAAAAITEDMKNRILDGTLIQMHDFDNIELTKAYLESKSRKDVSYTNDTTSERVVADYTLEAYLQGQSDYKSVLNELVTRQKNDTFYDLLPMGMTYARDSAVANLIGQTNVLANVSVEQIANYRDTGRTLLIFHVSTDKDNYNNYRSGYTLKFKAYYPWEEIQEYGRTPRNSMAYKSGEGDFKGFADDGGKIKEGYLLADLDGIDSDVKDTVYADVNKSLIWNTASINGFSKRVKSVDDEGYGSFTMVYEGDNYSYRLRYGSEANTTSEGIILYDVLEDNYGSNEYWKGTFESVDTTSAENKGIQPVVYYSTKEGITITNESAPDLTDTSVWSRTMPKNKADVTAVAVDLSTKQDGTPFVLEENAAVSVIINMKAPDDGVNAYWNNLLAYNTSWIKATTKNTASTTETTAVTQSDATEVRIEVPYIEVEKINDGGDPDDTFNFTAEITGCTPNTEYPVGQFDDEWVFTETSFKTDAEGNGSYTGTLKGGERFELYLPMGAKYTISEEGNSKYLASYKVENPSAGDESLRAIGPDYHDEKIVSAYGKAGKGETPTDGIGESLSTAQETVDEKANLRVTFTNDSIIRKVEIWKQISGRYENVSDHRFDFRLDVTGKASDSYKVILPDGTEDKISLGLDGKASYDFTLKGSEVKEGAEKLTVELPIGATYQVTELAPEDYGKDYKPKFQIGKSGTFADQSATGEAGKELSTAVETADVEDDKTLTVKFTNTGIPANLHIEKEVTGTAANKSDSFEYVVHFKGLKAGETYDLDGYRYAGDKETPEGVTMFLPGEQFNVTVKQINDSDVFDYWDYDESVTAFVHSTEAPAEGVNTVVVSTDDSEHEILAWFVDGTLYWYSEAEMVYLNYDASCMFAYFEGITSMSALADVDTSYTINMSEMFEDCASLTDISGLADWDVSNVTDMSVMFGGYPSNMSITNVDALSNWNVSSVTDMSDMFIYGHSLVDISGLANWDVSNVKDMSGMFHYCDLLADISGLANWDTGNLRYAGGMFEYCYSLVDVSSLANWDVSNVTSMSCMFRICEKLTSLKGLENWDVSSVTNMYSMFGSAKRITNLDALSNWDVSNVTDMNNMFYGLQITNVDAFADWDVSSVTNMNSMFNRCSALTNLNGLEKWDVSNVTDMYCMFAVCTSLTNISGLKDWDVSNVTNTVSMFYGCSALANLTNLVNWDVSNVTNMYCMFYKCGLLTDVSSLTKWDVSSVTNMTNLFANCTSLADASILSSWNVNSESTGLDNNSKGAFYGCTLLEEHPSKYPTWYGAYRGLPAAKARMLASPATTLSEDLDNQALLLNDEEPVSDYGRDDYSTLAAAKANADSGRFVADANGEAYYVFHLKHGSFIDIKDLNPEVQYEITEVGNSYIPSYTVTEGSEYTVSDSGKKETTDSDLSTGTETLTAGSSISYIFTNTKEKEQNVTITKKVDGDLASVTDTFHYTAELSGLVPGAEYTLKNATSQAGNQEGTFDFSKYAPESFDLTEELMDAFDGYKYSYSSYYTYVFDKRATGLSITNQYGVRYDGFDKISIHTNLYGTYYAYFINSSTGEQFETFINEKDISAYPLTGSKGDKTIDLSSYQVDLFTKVSEEDLQTLDGAVFTRYDDYYDESYTSEFTVIDGKLQIAESCVWSENGQWLEDGPYTYTGDSFFVDIKNNRIYLWDSTNPSSSKVQIYSVSTTGLSAYYKVPAVETTTFTADESGNAVLEWTMKANDAYEIMGLPEGATYQVTEAGAEKYIASYEITDNNDADGILDTVAKVKDENFFRNRALSTAEETVDLYEDVVITFTNTAPMPVLPSTGSNTALLLTLLGLTGIAGYGVYETLRRKKRNNMAV